MGENANKAPGPADATSAAGQNEFVISRVFAAPRDLVFRAWIESEHMAAWWGPHGYTNPVCRLDPRPGGAWYILMRGPDGVDHPCKGVYREVVSPERIVMTIDHSDLPDEWHDMLNPDRPRGQGKPTLEGLATVTFDEHNDKTTLTIRIRYESSAIRDALLKMGMSAGWSQSLERLATVAAAMVH